LDVNNTNKQTRKDYKELYTGTDFLIDGRIAQILMLLFINFMYGAGIPLLYPVTLLTVIFIYWVDKVLFLKLYKLPKNFDEKIQETVRLTLEFLLLIHISFAIWTYGSPDIFGNENQLSSTYQNEVSQSVSSSNSYYAQQISARIFLGHNVPLDALFVIVVCMLLLKYVLFETLEKLFALCCKCCTNHFYVDDYTAEKLPFYQLYTDDELIDELEVLDSQIRHNTSPDLKILLNQRMNALELELQRRENLKNYQQEKTFISLASYNVMLNPKYKPFIKSEIEKDRQQYTADMRNK